MTAAARLVLVVLLGIASAGAARGESVWDGARMVSRDELVDAMRAEARKGYALGAMSNAVRLQLGVMLALVEGARAADPAHRPLRIGHREYFEAYLQVTGRAAASAPKFATVPYKFGEDFLVDYRMEKVIARVAHGEKPRRAFNVRAGWPAAGGAASRYSYEDTTTEPHLEVSHDRLTAFRVLDFGDAIVYDDMRGIHGRATSGLLGLVFSLLGNAQAVQSRFAVAGDGVQVSRTTAQKGWRVTQTVTIDRDGKVRSGLPRNRPDLERLEARLAELDFSIVYVPLELSEVPRADR